MTAPSPQKHIACRIGPLVLAAQSTADDLVLSRHDASGADAVLHHFAAVPDATPDLTLNVEHVRPDGPPPNATLLYEHRTGWDLFDTSDGLLAVKAIPKASDKIKHTVHLKRGADSGIIQIAPEIETPFAPFAYTLSELLTLIASDRVPLLLVHAAACLDTDANAHLFVGASGAGKSTLVTLWDTDHPGDVLGDESHIVYRADDRLFIQGTPWPGSSGLFANRSAPLAAVWFLHHGQHNQCRPVAPAEAFANVLSNTYLPVFDRRATENASAIAEDIANHVPANDLFFVPDASAPRFILGQNITKRAVS
jgi:hypothetical protein